MFKNYSKYEVFDDGRIWSYKTKRFLKPSTNNLGYQVVTLSDNEGKIKTYNVHRVVWEAVTGSQIPEGYEINHIDENKDNNSKSNLELVSHKENINWGTRNFRSAKSQSKQVGAFNNNGELVMTFPSTQEAERQGFYSSAVSKCCNGKLEHYKGYTWRYI